jgi:protein TonB
MKSKNVPVVSAVVAAHLVVLALALNGLHFASKAAPPPPDRVIDMVDIREFVPPPPPKIEPPKPQAAPPPVPVPAPKVVPVALPVEKLEVTDQPTAMAVPLPPPAPVVEAAPMPSAEPTYLPQSKISEVPLIPAKEVLARINYPVLAAQLGLEATVYLELFIDQTGLIRKVSILKDPGNGFAAAAVAALEGVRCRPAVNSDGQPVAVRFRYPVRFTLK